MSLTKKDLKLNFLDYEIRQEKNKLEKLNNQVTKTQALIEESKSRIELLTDVKDVISKYDTDK